MIKCGECNCKFSNSWSLKRHVLKKHPARVSELVSEVYKNKANYLYSCDVCGKNFNKKNNLTYHKKTHGIIEETNLNSNRNKKCPLCDYSHASKKNLIVHIQEVHSVEIVNESRNFSTKEEFHKWKSQLETETVCKFVKVFSKSVSDRIHTQFACHRSGKFISEGKGIRRLKAKGSVKMNAFCPASLNVLEEKDGKCSVNFISKHIGHTNDLSHINLTKEERKSLATKIASKIPFDDILEENRRTSFISNDVKRIHLVTRKDLHNIKSTYNLNSSAVSTVKHTNDAVSFEAWINEMRETNDCVLYYKPQKTLDTEHNELKREDFILIIMNKAQSDILQKYGTDCICLDDTHGLNNSSNNFELITLMVLDDMRQGFPCAFLISNRTDEAILKIFFSCIRERVGCLKSKTFMSNMEDSFYNAWLSVMGETRYRLYCTWHIERAWRENLSEIKPQEKQASIYKQLRSILVETDQKAFTTMLEQFHKSLSEDEETFEFANCFKNYYMPRCHSWAYCYRLNVGINNTNMHLENMHKMLKNIYLNKGKTAKRLDKTVSSLMKFARDKLFNRLVVMTKGKISSKLRAISSRHKDSLKGNKDLIVQKEDGWEIQSPSNNCSEVYWLKENNDCKDCQCQLVCTDCGVCIHRYTCSCIDSSFGWNMCKHIHLLCQSRKDIVLPREANKGETDGQLHIDLQEVCIEKVAIVKEISASIKTTITKSFEEKKRELERKMTDTIHNIFKEIQSPYELHEFEKMVTPLFAKWEAIKLHK